MPIGDRNQLLIIRCEALKHLIGLLNLPHFNNFKTLSIFEIETSPKYKKISAIIIHFCRSCQAWEYVDNDFEISIKSSPPTIIKKIPRDIEQESKLNKYITHCYHQTFEFLQGQPVGFTKTFSAFFLFLFAVVEWIFI